MEEWGSGGSGGSGGSLEGRGARALHAGKSPGEWSAGESLLMLEDACKNERKHSQLHYLLKKKLKGHFCSVCLIDFSINAKKCSF